MSDADRDEMINESYRQACVCGGNVGLLLCVNTGREAAPDSDGWD